MSTDTTRVPILLYHSVSDDPNDEIARWNVSKQAFIAHIDAIVDRGCTALTISQYLGALKWNEPMPSRPVLITFDDGFAEVASFAAPALAERGIASTVYVTTGSMSDIRERHVQLPKAPMIASADLSGLENLDVEIGAHSHTHPQLDVIDDRRARAELIQSKEILEDLLHHRVRSFAYPHGYSSPKIRRMVKEVGYESACGVRNAFSSPSDNAFSISRLTVEDTTSIETIHAWLDRKGARVGDSHECYRTHLWRYYRRARFDVERAFHGRDPLATGAQA